MLGVNHVRVPGAEGEAKEASRPAVAPGVPQAGVALHHAARGVVMAYTKLLGPAKRTYYLFVILHIFSRHVVGWMPSGSRRPWPSG